jgi:predicted dehydrogenase
MKKIGVGLIGFGFMGRIHTLAYKSLPIYYDPAPAKIKLKGVCDYTNELAQKAKEQGGFEYYTTDYKKLINDPEIDIINCCTPNNLHKEILLAAIKAGKHVYCDKPLAMNLKEAKDILKAYKKSKIISQMALQYRFIPALIRAKQLIDEGLLGKVYSVRSAYLHSGAADPKAPLSWKLSKKVVGDAGVLYDLGSHALDVIRFLLGEYKSVFCTMETFTKKRPLKKDSTKMGKVEIEDVSLVQFRMKNGGLGIMEATKVATGTNDEMRIEIHGSLGAIKFNLMEPNWLEVYDVRDYGGNYGGDRGFKKIEAVQRYPKPAVTPSPKFSIGWVRFHIAGLYNFIDHIVRGKNTDVDIEAGYKIQEVMQAAIISAKKKEWINLPLKEKGR